MASAFARPISARRRDPGIARRSGSARASAAAEGNRCVTDPTGCASGSPYAATSRAASVAAPASETCCPSTARIASSSGSTTPGTLRPGAPHDRADQFVAGQRVEDRLRIGVEVEQSPGRRDRRVEVAGVLSQNFASTVAARGERDDARSAGQAKAAEIDATVDLLNAGNGPGGEELHEARDVARRPIRQTELDRAARHRSEPETRINSSRSSPGASRIAPG